MPREVIKYLCDFKCGTSAKSNLPQIQAHEAVCFLNPACKTCRTCKHEEYFKETTDHGELYGSHDTMVRDCKHEIVRKLDLFDNLIERSEYHSQETFHKHPVRNCPYWEAKTT
jgi:hypothetical protein